MTTDRTPAAFGRDMEHRIHLEGGQWETEFDNGYGASVIRNRFSYGGAEGFFEVAVTHDGSLCYATPVTSDVLGWLDEDAVRSTINAIEALPVMAACSHGSPE